MTKFRCSQIAKQKEVEKFCAQAVPNLSLHSWFPPYDLVNQSDLNQLASAFETLLVSSLAVKYYIDKLDSESMSSSINFSSIYYFDDENKAAKFIYKVKIDFSSGIYIPASEATATSDNLPPAVVYNKDFPNAFYRILLPTESGIVSLSINLTIL